VNNFNRMNPEKIRQISILKNTSGTSRFIWALAVLFVLGIVITAIILLSLPAVQKRIPKKDPYSLVSLDEKRERLFGNLLTLESDSDDKFLLAESAFLKGEIHEAEYFLSISDLRSDETKALRESIEKYKALRLKLEKYLYQDNKFNTEPYVFPDAYGYINQILELSDKGYIHVRHLFLKGYLLLKEGRRTEARRIFDGLIKNGGVLSDTSLYLYAKSYLSDSDKQAGITAFEKYIEQCPDARLTPLACYYLSKLFLETGNSEKVVEIVKKGIALGKNSEYLPDLLIIEENVLRTTSPESADAALLNLLKKYPSDNVVFKRALEKYENWDKGKIKEDRIDLLLEICSVLIKNGRYHQSKKLLDKLIPSLRENNLAFARYLMAEREKGVGEFTSAINQCKKAAEKTSDNELLSKTYSLMGEVYGLKKDVSSAEKYYVLSGKANGSMSDYALREVARIAYYNGWQKKAETYYGDLLESFPDSKYVSEALNYLVVLSDYNHNDAKTEEYAKLLSKKGTNYDDRLKGSYYLSRIGVGDTKYTSNNPLSYYSFIAKDNSVDLYLEPSQTYPDVNKYKNNLAWEYFLAGCFDLAQREYEFMGDSNDPYGNMILCYLAFLFKSPHYGILATENFTAANLQSKIEKGYSEWFFSKTYPIKYLKEIEKYSSERNLPISFILAIIRQESFFKEKVKSSSGALGLMQIMPSTGKWIAVQFKESGGFKDTMLTEPERNLKYGTWYLSHLRDLLGNEHGMILAGHNGGPGNVKKWKEMFPIWDKDKYLFYEMLPIMETRNFIRHVTINERIYKELLENEKTKVYF